MKNSNLLIYKKINKNSNSVKQNNSIIKKINNLIPILTITGLVFHNISYWIYYLHQSGIFDALKLPRNLIPAFNIIDSISFLFSYIPIILIGLINFYIARCLSNVKLPYKIIYSIFSILTIHFIISLTIFFSYPWQL